jgi:hypothetical protein
MTDTVKLEWTDICRHEPRCECNHWLLHTVPNYRVYVQAYKWLQDERGYKFICAEGEGYDNDDGNRIYSGRYTFKFLCEQEYIWFKLRWT